MRLSPFVALRHDPAVAGPPVETSAPAFGEVDPFAYAEHRTANPYTVMELLAGEGAQEDRWDAPAATYRRWRRTGVVAPDVGPALWVYEIAGDGVQMRGVVGTVDTDDVDAGMLLEHEGVIASRAARRAARLRAVPLDLTPVTAVHLGAPDAVTEALAQATRGEPAVSLTDEGGLAHRLWRLDDPVAVAAVCDGLAPVVAVLADGHHRLAAARHARALHEGAGWRTTLTMVIDATTYGPTLRAVHRMVRTSHPDPAARLRALEGLRVQPWGEGPAALEAALADQHGLGVGLVTADGAWLVTGPRRLAAPVLEAAGVPEVLARLDVTVAEDVLFPLLGVYDDRPVADAVGAASALAAGPSPLGPEPYDALVLLRPPSVADVFAVAQAGERMPAKSTWFWPKPRAGLLMRDITGG